MTKETPEELVERLVVIEEGALLGLVDKLESGESGEYGMNVFELDFNFEQNTVVIEDVTDPTSRTSLEIARFQQLLETSRRLGRPR